MTILTVATVCVAWCVVAASLVSAAGRPSADLFQPVLWDGVINDRTAANPHMQAAVAHISVGMPPVLADMSSVLPYAQVAFSNSEALFNKNGWHGLFVEVSEQLLPLIGEEKAYYAAGFGEGYVTAGQIYNHYRNSHLAEQQASFSNASKDWINAHINHMYAKSAEGGGADPYNNQLRNLLALISGITDGYNNAIINYGYSLTTFALNVPALTFMDIFLISFSDEIDDVVASTYVVAEEPMPKKVYDAWQRVGTHCSALVKRVTTGAEEGELFFSHVTWGSLEHMLRMYKTYRFGGFQVQFSGFPGNINSGDDFYVLNNNLTVMETTNNNVNATSLQFVTPASVSEFLRVLIMHKISAGSAKTWATGFCDFNSGTYNNQWMVLEMGAYVKTNVDSIVFWIVEQMPGLCVSGDQSDVLKTEGYWASYNRPFFPEVFAYSGYGPLAETVSTYYSYAKNYRAEIFHRDQGTVVSEATMKAIMRYNDYENDEFSIIPNCTAAKPCDPVRSPYLSIANRADLIPLNATTGVLGEEITNTDMAAYDAKIISHTKYMAGQTGDMLPVASIISGPTHGGGSNLPKFSYSTSLVANLSHFGIPDEVAFDWVETSSLFEGAPVPYAFPVTAEAAERFTYMEIEVARTFIPELFNQLFPSVLVTAMAGQDVTHHLDQYTWTNEGVKLVMTIRMGKDNIDPTPDAASVFASYKATQIAFSALNFPGLDALTTIKTSMYHPKVANIDAPVDPIGDYWIVPLGISGFFGILAILTGLLSRYTEDSDESAFVSLPTKEEIRAEDASGYFVDRA